MAEGIERHHGRSCASRNGGACSCRPSYRASVFDARTGRRVRKVFPTQAAARSWRQDTYAALRSGALRLDAQTTMTVEDAARSWLDGASAGQATSR